MSNIVKAVIVLGLVTVVSACAKKKEEVMVAPAPVMSEPTSSKY